MVIKLVFKFNNKKCRELPTSFLLGRFLFSGCFCDSRNTYLKLQLKKAVDQAAYCYSQRRWALVPITDQKSELLFKPATLQRSKKHNQSSHFTPKGWICGRGSLSCWVSAGAHLDLVPWSNLYPEPQIQNDCCWRWIFGLHASGY
jgi:hypothetical protein